VVDDHGQSEVGELGDEVSASFDHQQDVLGLDVSMKDVIVVEVSQCICYI
jgi:hypothetical protein